MGCEYANWTDKTDSKSASSGSDEACESLTARKLPTE
jgi:hypothetical protein